MSDVVEVDLHKVIRVLIKRRVWLLGSSLLVGLAVFLFLVFQPKMYEATAVVALTEPRYMLNFDQRYQTVKTSPLINKLAMDIALSQEFAVSIFTAWENPQKNQDDWYEFAKKRLFVKAGGDSKVVMLTVRLDSGQEAARLANLWAKLIVDRINILYSGEDQDQVVFFEEQVKVSSENLEKAQDILAEFEERNEITTLIAQLDALLQQQRAYLLREQLIASLKRDANALLMETDRMPGATSLPSEIQIRLLALQLRQYSDVTQVQTDPDTPSSLTYTSPFQYQLPTISEAESTDVATFRSSIRSWLASLDGQSTEIKGLLEQYPQNLAALQKQIEILREEKNRLHLDLDVASETYETLYRKYQEASISIKDKASVGSARIATLAFPTTYTSWLERLLITLIAMIGGATLAATFILVQDWWMRSDDTPDLS